MRAVYEPARDVNPTPSSTCFFTKVSVNPYYMESQSECRFDSSNGMRFLR